MLEDNICMIDIRIRVQTLGLANTKNNHKSITTPKRNRIIQ